MKFFYCPGAVRHARFAIAAILGATVLYGCSGEDGDQVTIAGGQSSDPVVLDIPIAYIKRPLPLDDDEMLVRSDAREAITFTAGGDVFVRERASPSAEERNITFPVTGGLGDVRDLDVSYDGEKLVFALRLPLIDGLDDDEQPTWNIWEYDLTGNALRRLITSDITAEAGHDIGPTFLPDGRIVFTSTRQRTMKAILLDEGKPQFAALDGNRNEPAFLLHAMNEDGSGIEQISYNQSHDLDPIVLSDGSIAFSRWDNVGPNNEINLYRIQPDGSGLELLYGAESHATGSGNQAVQFLAAQPMPDGQLLVKLQPFQAPSLGADLVTIDTQNYVENSQVSVAGEAGAGPAQRAATVNAVATDDTLSLGGRYNAAFPLFDGTQRLFVSWSDCRIVIDELIRPCTPTLLEDPNATEAPPLYGLWLYDRNNDTQLPVVAPEEGIMYSDVVATQPRDFPDVVFSTPSALDIDPSAVDENVGLLHIRSVYDIDGIDTSPAGLTALADPAQFTADERPTRFIRITKAVSQADRDVIDVPATAFGRSVRQGMREIIGYAPVEPDGSVMVKVPANVALSLDLLDARGRLRIGRHQNWLQVRAGELVECNGCHLRGNDLSHGRMSAFASVNAGAPTTGEPFPNTRSALFADFGETMAEVRARLSCATDCAALRPSVDLEFEDVWTDPVAAGRPADAPFSYAYADLETPPPVDATCWQPGWTASCRIVINYEEHIHPLWALPRVTLADDGVTVLSDRTCTACHNIVDAAGQPQVPAAQLDLSDGISADQADHFKAYRELNFQDNEQELDMGVLQDRLIEVGVDPDTMEPIFQTVPVSPVIGNSATQSPRFFGLFDAGGAHAGYLSEAELRLLSEWVDIGTQYYNNPFAVPQD